MRTKRDRFFRRPMMPWRMPLLLPRDSRKMAAGTDLPFSLRTTEDTRLYLCDYAGKIARAFVRDKIDRLFRQPARGAGTPLAISGIGLKIGRRQPREHGQPDRFGKRVGPESRQHTGAVHLDRPCADAEIVGHLLGRAPGDEPIEHLAFP